MAPSTLSSPRRRSPRLACRRDTDEGAEQSPSLSPRRTTSQLRLPTPLSAKDRVRKSRDTSRSPERVVLQQSSGRSPVRGRRGGSAELTGSDTAGSSEDTARNNGRCPYCSPEASPDRCLHNRGTAVAGGVSIFGPGIVLASVETSPEDDAQYEFDYAVWTKDSISPEKRRDLDGVTEALYETSRTPRSRSPEELYSERALALHFDKSTPDMQPGQEYSAGMYPNRYMPDYTNSRSKSSDEEWKNEAVLWANSKSQQGDTMLEYQDNNDTHMDGKNSAMGTSGPTPTDKPTESSYGMAELSPVYASEMALWTNWASQGEPLESGNVAPPPTPDWGLKWTLPENRDIPPLVI